MCGGHKQASGLLVELEVLPLETEKALERLRLRVVMSMYYACKLIVMVMVMVMAMVMTTIDNG